MKLRSLDDLLVRHIKTLRGAEKQITKSLPKIIGSAASPPVIAALESMVEGSKSLRLRLTQVADSLDRKCSLNSCDPVAGLLEEARTLACVKKADPLAFDIALTGVAQRLIRYRMVAYAQARILAENTGNARSAELLRDSLQELLKADDEMDSLLNRLLDPPVGTKVTRLVDKALKRVRPLDHSHANEVEPTPEIKQPEQAPAETQGPA